MSEEKKVSLANILGGAAIERWDDEFDRVVENICDPNTDPKAMRSISLKVKIKPNDKRSFGIVSIECDSRICPPKAVGTEIFIGKGRDGVVIASENNLRQPELPGVDVKQESDGNVVAMGGTK